MNSRYINETVKRKNIKSMRVEPELESEKILRCQVKLGIFLRHEWFEPRQDDSFSSLAPPLDSSAFSDVNSESQTLHGKQIKRIERRGENRRRIWCGHIWKYMEIYVRTTSPM